MRETIFIPSCHGKNRYSVDQQAYIIDTGYALSDMIDYTPIAHDTSFTKKQAIRNALFPVASMFFSLTGSDVLFEALKER